KAGRTLDGFDICPTVPLAVGDDKDITTLADTFRPYTALYVGGMGSRKQNFYNQLARRMGYEQEAAEIQDKYLSGDKQGAAAAVPHDLIDSTTLLGSVDRIADRMKAYAAAGVTTLTLAPAGFTLDERLASLRAGTEALERAGLACSSSAVAGARGTSPPRPSRGTTPGRRRGYARAPAIPIACRPDRARVVPVLPPFGAVVRHTCCPGRAPAFDSSPASPRKRWSRCFRPGVCSRRSSTTTSRSPCTARSPRAASRRAAGRTPASPHWSPRTSAFLPPRSPGTAPTRTNSAASSTP